MPSTYGVRAVPLGPSCDLVVAGKAGMDGLWLAGIRPDTLTGKGLSLRKLCTERSRQVRLWQATLTEILVKELGLSLIHI